MPSFYLIHCLVCHGPRMIAVTWRPRWMPPAHVAATNVVCPTCLERITDDWKMQGTTEIDRCLIGLEDELWKIHRGTIRVVRETLAEHGMDLNDLPSDLHQSVLCEKISQDRQDNHLAHSAQKEVGVDG